VTYSEMIPFGVVEAVNGNLRTVIRRGRGYRDLEYLILKTRKEHRSRALAAGRMNRGSATDSGRDRLFAWPDLIAQDPQP
jgi:hypothetical protein